MTGRGAIGGVRPASVSSRTRCSSLVARAVSMAASRPMSSCVFFIGLSQPPGVLYRFCTGQTTGVPREGGRPERRCPSCRPGASGEARFG